MNPDKLWREVLRGPVADWVGAGSCRELAPLLREAGDDAALRRILRDLEETETRRDPGHQWGWTGMAQRAVRSMITAESSARVAACAEMLDVVNYGTRWRATLRAFENARER